MNTQSGPTSSLCLLAIQSAAIQSGCRKLSIAQGENFEGSCMWVYAIADYILSDSSSRYVQLYPAHAEATLTDFHEFDPCVRFT